MTIGTECPHCESVFQVAAELVGKSMRCPNPTCREVFTVAAPADAQPALLPQPVPGPVVAVPVAGTGTVADYLQVLEAERIDPPLPDNSPLDAEVVDAEPVTAPPIPKAAPLPAVIPKAAPLPPTVPGSRAPVVVDWSEDQAAPGGPPRAKRRTDRDDESDVPIRSRPRGGYGLTGKVVLGALVVLLLVVGGGILTFFLLGKAKNEETESAAADAFYKDGKFAEAKRKFDELAKDYPDSDSLPKYKFFAALSQAQTEASSVMVKEDPGPARRALDALIAEHGDSPMAQPNTGYGADVVMVGIKVGGAHGDHAAEQVKKFQAKREDVQLLAAADKSIADGRALLPTLEKFRDKSGLSTDDTRKKFDDVEASVKKERDRLAALAPWRNLATDPTDVRIEQFERAMKAAGLEKDGEVLGLVSKAKQVLRNLVIYTPDPKAAGSPPLEIGSTLTVVPRVFGSPDIKQLAGKQDAVFGVAHGVLYAADVRTGAKLWAERVSSEARAADAPLRVTLADGNTDWVIVPSVRAGQPGLTARGALTGEAAWHQPLPAPVLGRPVRIGERLIVPLADARGTLLYLNLIDGTQLGQVELRQPIGGGIATLRGTNGGHGFVVVPADARRVFVFEVGKVGDDGKRQPPQVVRVFATNHSRGSLLGAPLLIDPDNPAQQRRAILAQSDGPAGMRLRSFPLPNVAELGQASADGDTSPGQIAEVSVAGWSWFPPVTNGERVAVCTDKGAFAAFGLNLPGQADKPIFQLPAQQADPDPASVSRSQVVWMNDDTFWVIVSGKLTRLRVASDPTQGMKIVSSQQSTPIGEPISAPQVRTAEGIAVVTTKATETGTVHLTAFDLNSGEVRWKRQLGAVAVAQPVPLADGSRLLVDECGGIYRVTADGAEPTVLEKCEPKAGCVSPAVSAVSADGTRVWVAVHAPSAEGLRLSVRVLKDGKPDGDERAVGIPAGLGGNAITLGDSLLFPLSNKFIYRLGLKDADVTQGPAWGGANAKPDLVCHLSATPDGQFVFGDGNTQLFRRKWPDAGEAQKTGGPWELPTAMTCPAVVVTAEGKEWIVAADGGGVAVFDPAKPSADPVRRWHGVADGELPQGAGSAVVAVEGKVCWSAGGRVVAMASPANDKPDWVFPLAVDAGEVVGLTPLTGGSVLVTCSSGVVLELNGGEVKAEAALPTGGPLAKATAVKVGEKDVLLPLADGTTSRLTLRKR